jgi:hypothetical protein
MEGSDELAYHFDLQKSLRRMYDPKLRYCVKPHIAAPWERIEKKKPNKKITFSFEKKEDKAIFSKQREKIVQKDTENESDQESDERDDETFRILMSDDVPLTSDTSE